MARRLVIIASVGTVVILGAALAFPSLQRQRMIRDLGQEEEHAQEPRRALIKSAGNSAIPLFTGLLRNPDPLIRLQAVEALAELEGPSALPKLAPLRRDHFSRIPERLMEVAGTSTDADAIPMLVSGISDPDDAVRVNAVLGLGRKVVQGKERDPAALWALSRAVDDPHTPVAGIALLALQKALSIPTKFSLSVTPAQHEAAREQFRAWWKDHAPTGRPADHPAPRPVSGGPAPTFTLTDTDGKRWTLETAQGKTFIFHFFGTWCGPCVPDMLALERLHQQRPEVTILAAGLNEQSADDLRGYAKSQGITFPMAMCPGSVAERYGDVLKVPTTFVIDSFGRIHRRLDGPRILETYLAICDEVRTDELKTDELKTVR